MCIRDSFGGFEESFAFSLLLCNALAPIFDYLDELFYRAVRRGRFVPAKNKKA